MAAASFQGNGGTTQTVALTWTSPAIDAIPTGTNGRGTTITTDQRAVPRPQGAGCDMGAYETGDMAMQSLTANRNPVPRLSKLTYTATVSNAGAADATGVGVTDTVPAGEKVKSASASHGSCSVAAQAVTCNLGQVPAAATATVTIGVKVKAARGSMLSDTATVSATRAPRPSAGKPFGHWPGDRAEEESDAVIDRHLRPHGTGDGTGLSGRGWKQAVKQLAAVARRRTVRLPSLEQAAPPLWALRPLPARRTVSRPEPCVGRPGVMLADGRRGWRR